MLTSLRSRMTAYVIPALAVMVSGVFTLGCNEDISENAIFTDQQALVQRIDMESKDMTRQVDDVSQTLARLTAQVEKLIHEPKEQDHRTRELADQYLILNKAFVKYRDSFDKLSERVDSQTATITELTAKLASVESRSRSSAPTGASVVSASHTPSAAKPAVHKPTAHRPAPTRVQTHGSYHQVRIGQSLADIASLTGTSISALRAANRLPPGRDPYPGSTIYVPAGT